MISSVLSAAELARDLDGADAPAVLDCRFDLTRPEHGRQGYMDGHIPGAVYVSLDDDLSGPPRTDEGRHPMPDPAALESLFSRLGIANDTRVVAYDRRDGSIAARAWWLLRYMGHTAVAVLDGGFEAWCREGLPQAAGEERRAAARFRGQPRTDRLALLDDVPGAARLLDARAAARYRGEHEPLDPVAGHIPGARNLPYTEHLDARGCFLPAPRVRERLESAFDGVAPADVVYSCGSGVTACHLLLAASYAGVAEGRLYVGSFSEWCRDPVRPVATGGEPGAL